MKLEKLNDNQIRCTLNKSDLDKRELRLSELAYGSAKARALFRDMIQQASIELGFEADNIPLMIEAIPISNECLVLVVTKVEDPDELDTRFSRFSTPFDDEDTEEDYSPNVIDTDISDADTFDEESLSFGDSLEEDFSFDSSSDKGTDRQTADDALDLIAPFTQAIAQAKKEVLRKKQEASKKKHNLQIYTFSNLDTITQLSSFLTPFYTGGSRLYKDVSGKTYYLLLMKEQCEREIFKRACIIASDYGTSMNASYSTLSYFDEHFQPVFRENALETLNQLN